MDNNAGASPPPENAQYLNESRPDSAHRLFNNLEENQDRRIELVPDVPLQPENYAPPGCFSKSEWHPFDLFTIYKADIVSVIIVAVAWYLINFLIFVFFKPFRTQTYKNSNNQTPILLVRQILTVL